MGNVVTFGKYISISIFDNSRQIFYDCTNRSSAIALPNQQKYIMIDANN